MTYPAMAIVWMYSIPKANLQNAGTQSRKADARRNEAARTRIYNMRVLVGCEESQEITKAFRARGHEAYSCDLIPCSGGHPEWHIKHDIRHVISNEYDHMTMAGTVVRDPIEWKEIDAWDLMIAHPPCTHLANSGVCHLYNKDGTRNEPRWFEMYKAAEFFKFLLYAPIKRIVIENPIQHKYAREAIGVGPGQIIQPWMFGHMEQKATCFWLKNVSVLKETNNVKEEMIKLPDNQRQRLHYLPPSKDRAMIRAKTFSGIAKAMAGQWGNLK